jgi:poly-gamma-glutamate system protein
MKSVYWRPQKVSCRTLTLISLAAIGAWAMVHGSQLLGRAEYSSQKFQAARRAAESFQAIQQTRLRRGDTINQVLDPTGSGLLGETMTPVTSRPAELADKQTTINPNFAAAVVEMLLDAGVEPGDTLAVGWTGSLPAMNIALCAAMETLQLRPIVVASVTSSQYGANRPDLLWLDMERQLREQHLISFCSQAASVGGIADRGLGMSAAALELVAAGIRRNGLPTIGSKSRAKSIEERMRIYSTGAGASPIKAYVNVGGGVVSTGGSEAKRHYQPGLNRTVPHDVLATDSIMVRFAGQGIPVIHLGQVRALAKRYGFPIAPTEMPAVGTGRPFQQQNPSRWLAATGLLLILGLMQAFVLTDWGHRMEQQARFLFQRVRNRRERPQYPRLAGKASKAPRLMV